MYSKKITLIIQNQHLQTEQSSRIANILYIEVFCSVLLNKKTFSPLKWTTVNSFSPGFAPAGCLLLAALGAVEAATGLTNPDRTEPQHYTQASPSEPPSATNTGLLCRDNRTSDLWKGQQPQWQLLHL